MSFKYFVSYKCQKCGRSFLGFYGNPVIACEDCGETQYDTTRLELCDDALDQANLKLALMQFDAGRINDKMEKEPTFGELGETLLKTMALTAFGFLCLVVALYLLKDIK